MVKLKGNHIKLLFHPHANSWYVLVSLPLLNWNCRSRSLVDLVSPAITFYLICMSDDSTVAPLSFTSLLL